MESLFGALYVAAFSEGRGSCLFRPRRAGRRGRLRPGCLTQMLSVSFETPQWVHLLVLLVATWE